MREFNIKIKAGENQPINFILFVEILSLSLQYNHCNTKGDRTIAMHINNT